MRGRLVGVAPLSWMMAVCLASAASVASAAPARPAGKNATPLALSKTLLKEMTWRSIGPANCGGRVSDIDASEKRPATCFVATGTGGLFKTGNAGTTWSGVFEKEAVASIGAVALWQKNSQVVWVGTGEANSRNSSSWGNGVYRSTDGGGTWSHLGLEATRTIARMVLDPADSNVAYVAALGKLWGENPERGVYKTRDGGKTWQHSLKVDARTGAVDLVMDPSNSRVLYAAMYSRRRTPWSFSSGSTTGGIFKTTDGGATWKKLTEGLPTQTGRIGLALYRKDPRRVYAVIESDQGGRINDFEEKSRAGGVFLSRDGGAHWERLGPFAPRPFYFSQIRVQPDDSTRVYLLGFDLWISDDGGKHFRSGVSRTVHGDCHALWIDPAHGDELLLGTDGGIYASHDRGATWDFFNHLAIGEFYDLALDNREPYRVYGGLQDNQSWGGPSQTRFKPDSFEGENLVNGITSGDWYCLGGGDGFHVAVDPTDPDIVYFESQGAELERVNLSTGKMRYCRPSNKEGEPTFRFNWNSPFQISPHDPTVLWLGGNHLFRLDNRGERLERVSPDLTTRNPDRMVTGGSRAETYCTIVSLAESPRQKGRVWVGTDDGKVWVTPDGGGHWEDLTAKLKGVPAGFYVSGIEASHHDAKTAYVAIDGHRSDVIAPYLLVTRDGGQSWSSIASDLPKDLIVQCVREDLDNPRLLFVGTEFGIYMSLDAGGHWMKMEGLPTVAVDDIAIHPRDRDLVIGTHGRSVWIMDDITPFEHWTSRVLSDSLTAFAPRPATAFYYRTLGGMWSQRIFSANNPAFGATLNYFVHEDTGDGVSLSIADSAGHAIRKLEGSGAPGLHRVVWDLQGEPKQRIGRPEWNDQPEFVPPGKYVVTFEYGKSHPIQQTLMVRHAPGVADPGF